jgi:phosphopantetheine adenylyltransferase
MDKSSKFVWLFTNEHEQVLEKLGSFIEECCLHVNTHTKKREKKQQKNRKTYLCSVTARPDQSLSNTTLNQFTFNII